MKVDVLILYEHVARELESALLLKKKLEEQHYTVKILKARWNEGLYNRTIHPRIIITPWCYDNEEYDYICSTWIGDYPGGKIKIINLHCEQISGPSGTGFLVPKNKAKDVYHFAWGRNFKELLLKNGVQNDNIIITGSPKLDFFRDEYKGINECKETLAKKYGLDKNKKWILIIGNFSAMNMKKETIERARNKGFSAINTMHMISQKSYDEIISWLEEVIPTFSQFEFIYRPHPSEDITNRISNDNRIIPNFHLIKDLAISDWIVNSVAAFAWCSTSAIEVASAGVPILNFRPFDIPDELKFPMLEDIEQIYNVEMFRDYLRMIHSSKKGNLNKKFKESLSEFIEPTEKATVDITVDFIKKIYNSDDGLQSTKYDYIQGIIKTMRYVAKNVALKIGIRSKGMTDTVMNDMITKEKYNEYETRIINL